MRWFFFFILNLTGCSLSASSIKVVYTAALIDHFYDRRKTEYLHSLDVLQKMGITPYVVEACKTSSFFDNCGVPIFYSNVNDSSLRNKGVNEGRSLLKALEYFNFDDDDLIVKLTGRYFFIDDYFFTQISTHPDKDAYAKRTNLHPYPISEIDYFTGCFALKYKYFKLFLKELDFTQMENELLCIEWELGKFFQRHPEILVHNIQTAHVMAHVFGVGYGEPAKIQ